MFLYWQYVSLAISTSLYGTTEATDPRHLRLSSRSSSALPISDRIRRRAAADPKRSPKRSRAGPCRMPARLDIVMAVIATSTNTGFIFASALGIGSAGWE
jgi:hypothetical protein